jgi:hypothetical protein
MWAIDTAWFDVAVVSLALAAGNILFGHFEAHRPPWRRLLKAALTIGITVALAQTAGRGWAYGWMAPLLALVAWIHIVWLPRHGINGLTGEPRDRYLALVRKATLRDVFSGRVIEL